MTDKVELPGLVLLSDEPTPDHSADGLGMRRYAEVIAGAALNTPGPFTIGVFGGWGVGKTSVLKQALSLISEDNPESLCVWFNAWQYDHEAHPLVPLALEIAQSVDSRIAAEEEAVAEGKPSRWIRWREIGAALRTLANGLTVKTPFLDISGKDMLAEFDCVTDPASSAVFLPGLYQKAFALLRELAERRVDESGGGAPPPIVVFIDDLDRCMPRHALRLLQSIRLVLGQPGFVFVLALDREPIVCHLINEYKRLEMKDPDASGPAYLEKIVQLPLWVPSHQILFDGYIAHLLEEDALKANPEVRKAIESLADVLSIGTESNPRTLVRLINRLIADHHLFQDVENKSENWVGLCAVSRLLRQRLDPADYLSLVRDQRLCDELLRQEESGEGKGFKAWREISEKDPQQRTVQEEIRVSISRRLERTPSISALLSTELGQAWLQDGDTRLMIERLLAVEGAESSASSGEGTDAIEQAIREALDLPDDAPITQEHRDTVKDVDLGADPVTDDDLAYLSGLTSLTMLNLWHTQVTDAKLEHLKGLTSLSALNLWGTQVTGAGLKHLKGLTALTTLILARTQVRDAGLEHLKGLTSLTTLYLLGTQVTDAGLEHLKGLTALATLNLARTQVADAGLEHLKGLTALATLNLWETQVTDAGLEHLKGLTALATLYLAGTEVTDAGLEHLKGLTSLTELNLSGTQVRDAGLEHLKGLTALTELYLAGTEVTDAGLEHLKGLRALTELNLAGTEVTDAGLEHLKGLTSLKELDLRNTQVTDAGADGLKAAIPGLYVFL